MLTSLWMGRLSYSVSTMSADELAMRGATASATMELADFSRNISMPSTTSFSLLLMCQYSLASTYFVLRLILNVYFFHGCKWEAWEVLPKWMTKIIYYQFAMFVYDLYDYKLGNTAKWQAPAFDEASDLRVTNLWSLCEMLQHRTQGNINSLMVENVPIWSRILLQIFSWWSGIGLWNASFREPIISTMRDGSHVICYDWSLLCIEKHFDNLRKIAR